jgi:putative ABC transport system ATP-binding protein
MLVEFKDFTLKFSEHENPLFDKFNLDIQPGDFVVLIGGNGSGKSTLLKAITGVPYEYSGAIIINGTNLKHLPTRWEHCFMLNQNVNECLFLNLTVYENLVLWTRKTEFYKKNVGSLKETFKNYIVDFNKKLPGKLDMPVALLSGGEKQSLVLGLIFLNPPKLLLLDEHTSALDPKTAASIMNLTHELIQKHLVSCIMITHEMNDAEHYGNRIVGLKEGSLVLDTREKCSVEKLMHVCYEY